MADLLIEKDIKSAIRLLRYLTQGQGFASLSVFDSGAGGGFNDGSLKINLERDGLLLNKDGKIIQETPEELFEFIKEALNPFPPYEKSIEEINERYKKFKWNH